MALLAFLGVPPPKQKKMPTEQDSKPAAERISAIFGKQYATKN